MPASPPVEHVPEPVLITIQYLVHREPDGTLIWQPAEVLPAVETRLLADEELRKVIEAIRADPTRLVRRDRSSAPSE